MLPPSSLTVPDVRVSASGSSWKSFARVGVATHSSGRPAEGDALGAQRTGFWGHHSYGPVATADSARSSRPDGRTSCCSKVARYDEVVKEAPHHRGQMGAPVGDGRTPVHPTPSRTRARARGVTVLLRHHNDLPATYPIPDFNTFAPVFGSCARASNRFWPIYFKAANFYLLA